MKIKMTWEWWRGHAAQRKGEPRECPFPPRTKAWHKWLDGYDVGTDMSKPPTLADQVIRETYRPHTVMQRATSRSMSSLRMAIASASKFMLDDDMSAFLADLAHGPFLRDPKRITETMTVMRHGALLPHDKIWIEVKGSALKERTAQLHSENGRAITDPWGNKYDLDDPVADLWGFLVERSESDPSVIRATEFIGGDLGDPDRSDPIIIPAAIVWSTSDRPIFSREEYASRTATRGLGKHAETKLVNDAEMVTEVLSVLAHGIQGLYDPCIVSVPDAEAPGFDRFPQVEFRRERGQSDSIQLPAILAECSGVARYLISFLSTINDIPVTHESVKPSKGYVARGSYKKFVEHTVVRLNVPQRVSRARLAAKVTATIRRRAHEVRGHWRLYQRGEGALCAPSLHQWGVAVPDAEDKIHASCSQCSAHRTWIEKHQRGDASLGFVTHSYSVQHEVKA